MVNEIVGTIALSLFLLLVYWINKKNAKVVSYPERMWPWASLVLTVIGAACLISFLSAHRLSPGNTQWWLFALGMVVLFVAFLCYQLWIGALDEDSD